VRVIFELNNFGAQRVAGRNYFQRFVFIVEVYDIVVSFVGLPVAFVVLFHDLDHLVFVDFYVSFGLGGES